MFWALSNYFMVTFCTVFEGLGLSVLLVHGLFGVKTSLILFMWKVSISKSSFIPGMQGPGLGTRHRQG